MLINPHEPFSVDDIKDAVSDLEVTIVSNKITLHFLTMVYYALSETYMVMYQYNDDDPIIESDLTVEQAYEIYESKYIKICQSKQERIE